MDCIHSLSCKAEAYLTRNWACVQTGDCPCWVLSSSRSGMHFCVLLLNLKGEWVCSVQIFFCLLIAVCWTAPVSATDRVLQKQESWGEMWQGLLDFKEGARIGHRKTWRTPDPSACVQRVEVIRSHYSQQRKNGCCRTTLKDLPFLCGLMEVCPPGSQPAVKWKSS